MVAPFDVDLNMLLALNGDGGWFIDQLMWYVSAKLTWVPLYALILFWVGRTKGWQFALAFLLASAFMVLLADQTASFFKQNLPKFRPTHHPPLDGMVHTVNNYVGGLYGTVSSHAANSAGFAVLSSLVIRKRWVNWAMAFWVLLICYSRIYLGAHYPMDILLGLIEGVIWGALCYVILQNCVKILARRRSIQ